MNPFIRTIYFANKLGTLGKFVVIDVIKYNKIKQQFDAKAKGRYFLVSEEHRIIKNVGHEGNIQEFINRCGQKLKL